MRSLMLSALAVAGGLFLSGCAVSDYQKPIENLTAGLETSSDALNTLDGQLTERKNTLVLDALTNGNAILEESGGTCTQGARRCGLQAFFRGGKTEPYPVSTRLPKAKRALGKLKTYLGNLNAIVTADTADQIEASATEAIGSAKSIDSTIADTVGGDDTPAVVAQYSEPTSAAIGWLAGQYVDYVKHDALAQATEAANPVVQKLSGYLDNIAEVALNDEINDASQAFEAARARFQAVQPATQASINAYVEAASAYSSVLRARQLRPLASFAKAHATLTAELNGDGDLSLSDVIAAIQGLQDEARELKDLADQFKAAAEQ